MKTLLERPGTDQTLELLRLLVGKRLTRKVVQKILHESSGWFREELCQKLLLVAKEETLKMKDKDEHNTHKIFCLALIASVTKREDDIEKLRKAISSEDCSDLDCFILLASITKDQRDIRALIGTASLKDGVRDGIKSFVWIAKITGKTEYIEKARKEALRLAKKITGFFITLAAEDIAEFTKQEKDILFFRECISRMKKDEYFLKSSFMLSLFKITQNEKDINSARELISKIEQPDFKRWKSAELAALTKDPKDILVARQIANNDGKSLCYIAKATLSSSDIDRAYLMSFKAIPWKNISFMMSVDGEDADEFDVLLSAATEAKRFDVVERLIVETSGCNKIRACVRVYNKLMLMPVPC